MKSLLFLSSLMVISSPSWIIIWISLEVNTLSMCFILSEEAKKMKDSNSNTAVYFLVQSIASIVLICGVMSPMGEWSKMIIMLVAISLKMSVWPGHTWYLKVINTMMFGSQAMMLLMTWQKLAPLFLMANTSYALAMLLGLASILGPMASLSGQLSIKPMITLSSVCNTGWLVMTTMISPWVMMFFFLQYSTSTVMSLKFLKSMKSKKNSPTKDLMESTVILGNMGGLPPLMMFSAKITAITTIIAATQSSTLGVALLLSSCALLYLYCWALLSMVTLSPVKSQNPQSMSKNNKMVTTIMVMSMMAIIPVLLGVTNHGFTLMG